MKKRIIALIVFVVCMGLIFGGCASGIEEPQTDATTTFPTAVRNEATQNHEGFEEETISINIDQRCYIVDTKDDLVVSESNLSIQGMLDMERRFQGTMKIEGYEIEGSQLIQTEIANHPYLWAIYMKYTPSLSDDKGIEYSEYAYALFGWEMKAEKLLIQIRPLDTSTSFADYKNCLYAVCAENEEEAQLQYQRLIVELEDALALYDIQ